MLIISIYFNGLYGLKTQLAHINYRQHVPVIRGNAQRMGEINKFSCGYVKNTAATNFIVIVSVNRK